MRTVSRYLLREFALASGAVFLVLVVTWIAADTLLHVDEIGESARAALLAIAYRALDVFPLGVPMACLVGVVWSITRAVRAREITAIRCGGIPLRGALAPILVASVALAGALVLFEDRVVMKARHAQFEAEAGEAGGRGTRPVFTNGRWWYARGDSVFSAGRYAGAERALEDVTVFEYDDQHRIRARIDAESAVHLEGSSWEFRNAHIREFGIAGGLEHRTARALRVDLGLSRTDIERAEPPIEATTLHQLARRLREHRGRNDTVVRLEASLHERLAQPLSVVILILLAIPFAVGDVERGDSLPRALLAALVAAGAFWLAWAGAQLTARSGWVPAAFPAWTVVLLFLAIGSWRFHRVSE